MQLLHIFFQNTHFEWKIGIWPILEYTKAVRTSKYCVVGTPITKNINTTRKEYVRLLKEKVFPAIRENWPGTCSVI
jgi:hypothetical protein